MVVTHYHSLLMKKIVILDLETTGLDPETHEIIEIGAVSVDDGPVFSVKVHPLHLDVADPKALEVNGYCKEDWADACLLPHALTLLSQFVGEDRPLAMAYNVSFDRSFLERAYRMCDLPYPFHYHHLDLMTLVWAQKKTTLSLKTACLANGIPPEADVHRALGGAMSAYQLYKKISG